MSTSKFRDLSALLNPRAMAIVGASERPGSAGRLVLENLRQLDYSGVVYTVHPTHDTVLGYPCYPDLSALPGPVDHVAVLLAAPKVLPVLERATEVGARSAWVLASGYAEAGVEGQALQEELRRFATDTGLLLCGPNCIGIANLVDRVATYSVALGPATRAGNVSAVVQSGAVCMGLANADRIGYRYLISSGNEAVLSSADYIGHLAGDPHTSVVIAFIEGIADPQHFVAAAKAMREARKPLLVVKVGRSTSAQAAVQAHTGSLAGSDDVIDAVFRQLGVVRLDTLDQLLEAAALFSTAPLPEGNGVGLLSLSGGQIGLVADLAEEMELQFPDLTPSAEERLSRILPAYSPVSNPLDAWGSGDLENTYPACVEVVSQEEQVHLVAVSRDTPPQVARREVEQSLAVARAAVQARERTGKPVIVFSNISVGFHPEVRQLLRVGGVPYLQGTRETLKALGAFCAFGENSRRAADIPSIERTRPADLPFWRDRLQPPHGDLSEIEGRRLLAAYGIPGPREGVATTAQEAAALACSIGFPVAMKILSPDILHKTEIGGVRIDLADAAAVSAAFRKVMLSAQQHCSEARLDGVIVQEMIPSNSVEVILGILRDADFGPVVVFGSGGILVELIHDSSLRLPPLNHAQAMAMIQETRGAGLLHGFRGGPPSDVAALADALVNLSHLALDLGDRIAALDINPLMVLPAGQGVRAVDAVVELV